MRYLVAISLLLLAAAVPTPGAAQLMCATSSGTCALSAGAAGRPCFCVTPRGPAQGLAQVVGGGGGNLPRFCCTPAGRLPLSNAGTAPGQRCQAMTPSGMMGGQACY
jgi:hypothetical protein